MIKYIKESEQAFSQGSDLWIIADLESSNWAKKLDWYLNFQLRRASLFKPKKISDSNIDKISQWGVDVSKLTKSIRVLDRKKSALIVASDRLLPNRFTVQIPFQEKSIESWAAQCLKVLQDLKIWKARIFLPVKISTADFEKHWGSKEGEIGIELEIVEEAVLDPK